MSNPTNPTRLINRAAVKQFALQLCHDTRAWKPTRVSGQFLIDCNSDLEAIVRRKVHSHPSVGKTIT